MAAAAGDLGARIALARKFRLHVATAPRDPVCRPSGTQLSFYLLPGASAPGYRLSRPFGTVVTGRDSHRAPIIIIRLAMGPCYENPTLSARHDMNYPYESSDQCESVKSV
jgi:hypothetical protein